MNIAYVLYCNANKGYLTTGAVHTTAFTPNPLFAHIYHSPDAASRTGAQLAKASKDPDRIYGDTKPFKLRIHSIENPTIKDHDAIEATKVVSGYAIAIHFPKSEYHGAYVDYFKVLPYSVQQAGMFTRSGYHGIHSTIARGGKPKIWKTREGAERILEILKTDKESKGVWCEIVPHSH